jgi:hypothetical protein
MCVHLRTRPPARPSEGCLADMRAAAVAPGARAQSYGQEEEEEEHQAPMANEAPHSGSPCAGAHAAADHGDASSGEGQAAAAADGDAAGAPRSFSLDPGALKAAGDELEELIGEVLGSLELALALAEPGEPPLLVYRGRGVFAEAGDSGCGEKGGGAGAAAGPAQAGAAGPPQHAGGCGNAEGVEGSDAAAAAFAERVLDGVLVGAVRDALGEGLLEGGPFEGGLASGGSSARPARGRGARA